MPIVEATAKAEGRSTAQAQCVKVCQASAVIRPKPRPAKLILQGDANVKRAR